MALDLSKFDPKAWVTEIVGKGLDSLVGGADRIIKDFVVDPNKQLEASLQLRGLELQAQKIAQDAEGARMADVQSAREMYGKKSTLQNIFAMTFLVGYLVLTAVMVWLVVGWIGGQKISIPDWCVALISTVYGTVSSKLSTIVDFFFGSSKGSHDKDEAIGQAFVSASKSP